MIGPDLAGDRARGIAAIHAYADWLAQHPDVPMPTTVGGVTHQHNDEQESIRVVRAFADGYGARKLTSGRTGWAILTLTTSPVQVEHTIFTNTDTGPKSDWL